MTHIPKACERPHLKLLPQLQVDVIHLRDGNVVVLPLLLAEQLIPGTLEKHREGASVYLLLVCKSYLRGTFMKK